MQPCLYVICRLIYLYLLCVVDLQSGISICELPGALVQVLRKMFFRKSSRDTFLFQVTSCLCVEIQEKSCCKPCKRCKHLLGGGNSNICYFHSYLGKIPILTHIFQLGWNHQLACHVQRKTSPWETLRGLGNTRGQRGNWTETWDRWTYQWAVPPMKNSIW